MSTDFDPDQAPEDGTPDIIVDEPVPGEPADAGFGSLTVEDDPEGTVDPADLAGTADESDADVH